MREFRNRKWLVIMLSITLVLTLGMRFPAQQENSSTPDADLSSAGSVSLTAIHTFNEISKTWIPDLTLAPPSSKPTSPGLAPSQLEALTPASETSEDTSTNSPEVTPLSESLAPVIPDPATAPNLNVDKIKVNPTYEVTAYYLNVREAPTAKSNILAVLSKGAQIAVTHVMENGWLQLEGAGYVHGGYAQQIRAGDGSASPASEGLKSTLTRIVNSALDQAPGTNGDIDSEVSPRLDNDNGTNASPDSDTDANDDSSPVRPTSSVNSDSGLTKAHIAKIFEGTALSGYGLEDAVLEIEEEYGINAFFTIAVMKLESGNGRSQLAKNKNNLFGLNAVSGDKNNKAFSFKSKSDCVRKFGNLLAKNYVGKGYTTVEKVAGKYCPASGSWAGKVKNIMKSDYRKL